jgi:integrase
MFVTKSRPPTPEKELKYKIAIYIALFAGLRKSEILGLDWEHFNPVKQSHLRIEQTRLIGRAVGCVHGLH